MKTTSTVIRRATDRTNIEDLPLPADGAIEGEGFYGSFFDDVYSRGQSYAQSSRTCYRDKGSGYRASSGFYGYFFTSSSRSRANPQPEEGRRWMRQAVCDLKAAIVTLTHGGDGGIYNWACYQAHQV